MPPTPTPPAPNRQPGKSSSSESLPPHNPPTTKPAVSDDDVLGMLGGGPSDDDETFGLDDSGEIPLPGSVTNPTGAKVPAIRSPSAASPPARRSASVSDDEILSDLDDPASTAQPSKPREFKPSKALSSDGLSLNPAERASSERNKAKIAALVSQLGGVRPATGTKTLADVASGVALMMIFTNPKAAEAAWASLPADYTRGMTRQIKEVAGIHQLIIGSMLTPRKVLDVVRLLKSAGGIFKSYKADKTDVQQWLTEHLK